MSATHVEVVGGPYWQAIGRRGDVLVRPPDRYLSVLVRIDGEARLLHLTRDEVRPA